MKLINAIKRIEKKGYKVKKENDSTYSFMINGYIYRMFSQDGEVVLMHTNFNGSKKTRTFSNLKQMIQLAESWFNDDSETIVKSTEQKEIKEKKETEEIEKTEDGIKFAKNKRYAIIDYSRNVPLFFYKVLSRTDKTVTFSDEDTGEKFRKKVMVLESSELCRISYGDINSEIIY